MTFVLRRDHGDVRILLHAVVKLALGAPRTVIDIVQGRFTKQGIGRVWTAQGMLAALRGERHSEYVRAGDESL